MNVSEKDEIIQSMSMLIKNFENKMDTRLRKQNGYKTLKD